LIWIIGDERMDTFPWRIREDPRCAIGVIDFDGGTGRVEHVGMRGRASIEPFDEQRTIRLLRRYLTEQEGEWNQRFRAALEEPTSLLVRFTPETVVVRDQSYKPAITE
jgi:hypothetical protein